MATAFTCKVGTAGRPDRDFSNLTFWTETCNCDLTVTSTKVFSSTKHTGTQFDVQDQRIVYLYRAGVRRDCRAWFLHATETQCLVTDISGSDIPQAGDQWRQSTDTRYGWVTIQDAGDSVVAVAECYNDSDMYDYITLAGWSTNPTNYIRIYTPTTERHTGVADTGFKIYTRNTQTLLNLYEVDVLIQGIEFKGGGNQISGTYRQEAHTIRIDSCIFHDNLQGVLINIPSSPYLTTMIWNCALYDSRGGAIGQAPLYAAIHVENCAIYNPGGVGVYEAECYNVVIHRGNNLVDPCFGGNCTGDYNCDGIETETDDSAPGAHSLHNKTIAEISWTYIRQYAPYDIDQEIDLHVYTDIDQYYYDPSITSDLIGAGVDRSAGAIGFNTDIDGDVRMGVWTIGIDQVAYSSSSSSSSYSSSSSSSATSISSSSSSSTSTFWLETRDITYDTYRGV